jgi:hypothetical protein
MTTRFTYFLLLGIVLVLFSVSCKKIKTEPPQPTSNDTTLFAPTSVITVPLHYSLNSLEELVNSNLSGRFMDKWMLVNKEGDSLHLVLERKGSSKLQWQNGTLKIVFPLKASAQYVKRVLGVRLTNSTPVQSQIIIHLDSKIGIDKAWNLDPSSSLRAIDWVEEPELRLGMVRIKLKDPVQKLLFENQKYLLEELDKVLKEEIHTAKEIEKIWNDLQKPILINDQGTQVWLLAKGEALHAQFRTGSQDEPITLDLQFKANVEALIDTVGRVSPSPLPPYTVWDNPGDSIQLYVRAALPFARANEILYRELAGQEINYSGYKITIEDLHMYASDYGLVVNLKVKGAVKGNLYMVGQPSFDEDTRQIRMENFSYDLDTENTVVSAANKIFYDYILEYVAEKLVFDATPLVDELPLLIENAIEKGKVGESISLSINTLTARPYAIVLTSHDIQIILESRGKITMDLKKIGSKSNSVMIN